jgi:hypothetical protein
LNACNSFCTKHAVEGNKTSGVDFTVIDPTTSDVVGTQMRHGNIIRAMKMVKQTV